MKNTHSVNIMPREEQLRDVEGRLIDQLNQLIRMVEDRVHPDRIEQEYAYTRSLISSRNTVYTEKLREERRNALA